MLTHPLSLPVIWYALNYPIRGLIYSLSSSQELASYHFDEGELLFALTLSALSIAVSVGIVYASRRWATPRISHVRLQDKRVMLICFGLYITSLIYKLATGTIYQLADSFDDLFTKDLTDAILLQLEIFRWPCFFISLICWWRLRDLVSLLVLTVTAFLIVSSAVLVSSKGPIFQLAVAYLFCCGLVARKPSLKLVMIVIVAGTLYSYVSYIQRYYGTVRGSFDVAQIAETVAAVQDNFQNDLQFSPIISIANRLNYLDGLTLALRLEWPSNRTQSGDDVYQFGSFADLTNVIPRFIWSDRPFVNYYMFLAGEVWGFWNTLSEVPIGRIGESVILFGPFSLLGAGLFGLTIIAVGRFAAGEIDVKRALFFFTIMLYNVWPDAGFTFGYKPILITVVLIGAIYWLTEKRGNLVNQNQSCTTGLS